jgi:hypothetical protein
MKSAEPDHWVRVRIPDRFKLGPQGIADRCGWVLRKTEQTEIYNVALRENYEKRAPGALRARKVITASQAGDASLYEAFHWTGQDQFLDRATFQKALAEAERLAQQNDRVQFWVAFSLLNLVAPDAELPAHLHLYYPFLAAQLPKSSLWAIQVDPAVHSRRALLRGLLAADEAPEQLERSDAEFEGFEAGKGLANAEGVGLGALIQTALVAEAPGLLGMNTARLGGMVTLLFGHFESGRSAEHAAELIDLFRPNLLIQPTSGVRTFPKLAPELIEAYFQWWVRGVNQLLGIAADPAMFRKRDRSYDPANQFGFQLSLERLFATIQAILVASRRDEYTRLILAFQAFDLLRGLELGSYDTLADPRKVRAAVAELEQQLPPGPAALLLPRCQRAASALENLTSGFYLSERIEEGLLRLRTKHGGWVRVGMGSATAEYLNLVRDAGHTWREKMSNDHDRSLFVAHNGILDPSVADIPFVHLVRLLADPTHLKRRLTRLGSATATK